MARMNREILVPYLQDVCALHLKKKKCQDRAEELRGDCERIRHNAENLPKPFLQSEDGSTVFGPLAHIGCLGLIIAFGFIILCGTGETLISGYTQTMGEDTSGLLTIGAILVVVLFVLDKFVGKKNKETIRKQNEMATIRWRRELSSRRTTAKEKSEPIMQQIEKLENEIQSIDVLLSKAYSANLIPSRYRDLYAAVYLYDWFSTGISDDMDMALNTYVLEQIKSRLDTIIRNQAEQIINQRAILANQARTMNMIERNAQEMREKVFRMNDSLEKQNMYLNMIDSNVAATRFFAEETYKKWN